MDQKNYPPASLAWLVWGLGAAFYFSGFYHRVAPAVMTDQLMADFHIGAAALGNFTAFYFYSYFLMQVPTGILADHWGPRKLLTAGSFVAACGTILFASATSHPPGQPGKAPHRRGGGVGYVALLTLATRWFPARFFATLSGLALFCGVAGAVTAGPPLRFLVERFGWRPVMFVSGGCAAADGAAIWRIVSDDPARKGYRSFAPLDPETAVSPKTLLADLMTVLALQKHPAPFPRRLRPDGTGPRLCGALGRALLYDPPRDFDRGELGDHLDAADLLRDRGHRAGHPVGPDRPAQTHHRLRRDRGHDHLDSDPLLPRDPPLAADLSGDHRRPGERIRHPRFCLRRRSPSRPGLPARPPGSTTWDRSSGR